MEMPGNRSGKNKPGDRPGDSSGPASFEIQPITPSAVDPSFPPLSPALVLRDRPDAPFVLGPGFSVGRVDLIKGRVDLIRDQVNTRGIRGVCLGDLFTPQQIISFDRKMSGTALPVSVAVKARLTGGEDVEIEAPGSLSGIRLVEWVQPEGEFNHLSRILRAYSKAGIWNHLILPVKTDTELDESLIRFAGANPNIVHSWQVEDSNSRPVSSPALKTGSAKQNDPAMTAAIELSPLPGQPFWQALADPAVLLIYLDQYGLKKVIRWRVPDQGQGVVTTGGALSWHFVRPQALSDSRLNEICQLVGAGGSVDTRWVRYNLERAFLIAYVTEMGLVVACSSLKHPRPDYIAALSGQTGMDLSSYLERGYTSVRPEYRGLGIATRLLAGLTERAKDRMIFSLISEDNLATQKIALRNRTQKVTTFFSRKTGKQMGVWMPESMLDRHFRKNA
ncbi:MAG: hypothetical protein DSY90_13145 [Deltaproteobacteria bacterium]|nr:MAG: hypothetical protein DSY90_13145 [Deltaproteobacteria bacterium]